MLAAITAAEREQKMRRCSKEAVQSREAAEMLLSSLPVTAQKGQAKLVKQMELR